mmetsp:Transcript_61636/g.70678  ORF Transcript_61636/g.70678 Transcript_61636/m.70678 type:complete len:260 (-) Transcript_61636:755-1534(-)
MLLKIQEAAAYFSHLFTRFPSFIILHLFHGFSVDLACVVGLIGLTFRKFKLGGVNVGSTLSLISVRVIGIVINDMLGNHFVNLIVLLLRNIVLSENTGRQLEVTFQFIESNFTIHKELFITQQFFMLFEGNGIFMLLKVLINVPTNFTQFLHSSLLGSDLLLERSGIHRLGLIEVINSFPQSLETTFSFGSALKVFELQFLFVIIEYIISYGFFEVVDKSGITDQEVLSPHFFKGVTSKRMVLMGTFGTVTHLITKARG